MKNKKLITPEFYLDITTEVCPLTFVKTKLKLEQMPTNSTVEIRLQGNEPLKNVPNSIRDHGHSILSFEPEEAIGSPERVHRLIVLKNA